MKKVGIFGWGLVAPGASTIDEFEKSLDHAQTELTPFNGFGPDSFLAGTPEFDFKDYEGWISERFPPSRAKQLEDKMDPSTLYAVGSFIQSLAQNPGIEKTLQELGSEAHVYVANALGPMPTQAKISIEYYRAQRRWDRYWTQPERNAAYSAFRKGDEAPPEGLVDPETLQDADDREEAEDAWFRYWAARSEKLTEYLDDLREIEGRAIEGKVATGKMKLMRDKQRALTALQKKWQTPPPPWTQVSPNLLWNIPSNPAAQISMVGKITGLTYAPMAACSTFGLAVKAGMDAIERGEAKFVVVGAADTKPHPMTVGAFYGARVISCDGTASKPLTQLKGTHVAGGACVWILGDLEYARKLGYKPLGMRPAGVGTSADAGHIITPSEAGPRAAMRQALAQAGVDAKDVVAWDLHATATPGDFQELENLQSVVPKETVVSARKGRFGHGMGVGGGWELTAQYLGMARGSLAPTPTGPDEVHPEIQELGQSLVLNKAVAVKPGPVGKLSMGVGGLNACVISVPYDDDETGA